MGPTLVLKSLAGVAGAGLGAFGGTPGSRHAYEAAGYGRCWAVGSTKTNGGLDYVVDGETGILCGIDDVEALASGMKTLLADPALAQRMGNAGYEHLQRTCSEERFSELFISMIEEVAGQSTRS